MRQFRASARAFVCVGSVNQLVAASGIQVPRELSHSLELEEHETRPSILRPHTNSLEYPLTHIDSSQNINMQKLGTLEFVIELLTAVSR